MKLIECHIAGFGTFRNYRLSFGDGLNRILQPNGWGKTTLAAYIKAMLYGFERKRVHDVSSNERLRFRPWDGGKYGGTLDFEYGGVAYRVLRTFGAVGSGDTLKVMNLDTGEAVDCGGTEPGEWLFGLDANAFQRSVFIGQNGSGFDGSSASLRNRLNALVGEAGDANGSDNALEVLDDRRKFYKKRGNKGYLADVSEKITREVERKNALDSQIAQVERLEQELLETKERARVLAGQISAAQRKLDDAQANQNEVAALSSARDQLVARTRETSEALAEFAESNSTVLSDSELEMARQSVENIDRLEQEVLEASEKADAEKSAIAEIGSRYGGHVPDKAEIESSEKLVSELERELREIERLKSERPASYLVVDEALERDSTLLDRADAVVDGWPALESDLTEADEGQRQIAADDARWDQGRMRIVDLEREVDQARSEIPENADTLVENYEAAGKKIRDVSESLQATDIRIQELRERIADECERLGKADEWPLAEDKDFAEIDRLLADMQRAEADAKEARRSMDEESSRSDALRGDRSSSTDELQAAQSDLAQAESARAEAIAADAEARAERTRVQSEKKAPVGPIACIAAGLAAVLLGLVLGPLSMPSIGLYVAALVLVVIGVTLSSRGRSRADARSNEVESDVKASESALAEAEELVRRAMAERDTAAARMDEIDRACAAQDKVVSEARDRLSAAMEAEKEAGKTLAEDLQHFLPEEELSVDTIASRAPALKERIAENGAKRRRLEELRERLSSLEHAHAKMKDEVFGLLTDMGFEGEVDYVDAADVLQMREASIRALQEKLSEAERRLSAEAAVLLGRDGDNADTISSEDIALIMKSEHAPGNDALRRQIASSLKEASEYDSSLADLMAVFHLESTEGTPANVERLAHALSDYRAYREKTAETEASIEEHRASAGAISAGLDARARNVGLSDGEKLNAETLGAMMADATQVEKHIWARDQAHNKAKDAASRIESERRKFAKLLEGHGISDISRPRDTFDRIEADSKKGTVLAHEAALAREQLAEWQQQNGARLDELKGANEEGHTLAVKQEVFDLQRESRDVASKAAQIEERKNSLLQELEVYPDVAQETRLLSLAKQEASSKFFTVQKTSEFLIAARENLDQRYLGGLTERFNDYANSWLPGDGMELAVAGDFDVSVARGGSASHDVAGYSTGYRDLLDICLRMALVDILFEEEKPFIVMDDPFANLDQANIGQALQLLAIVSKNKQVIYFTCHPSRLRIEVGESGTSFTLPEQRKTLETPRERARREARERAAEQAEMVASYHVVPVTQGRVNIKVADTNRKITNNLFNLSFALDTSRGSRDNSFEVHFIDAKGRSLCERQNVEVVNGQIVPERLRFCLATHEDSGSSYDLIIHEQGRVGSELAARVPFQADISFAPADDFGF